MNSYNQQSLSKDIQAAKQVQQLSEELFRSTDISWFGYYVFQKNRDVNFVTTDPIMHEFYMKGQHYFDEFAHRDFEEMPDGIMIPQLEQTTEEEDKLSDTVYERFQLKDFLNIAVKKEDRYEVFSFSGQDSDIRNVYLNNADFLKNFTNVTHNSLNRIIKSNDICTVNVEKDNSNSAQIPNDYRVNNHLDIIINTISAGKNLSGIQQDTQLTQREKTCLKLLLMGKTAKQAAPLLGISNRTVEKYFDKVKKKLGCRRRQDLFTLFSSII